MGLFFLFATAFRQALGHIWPHCISDALSPWVKRLEREADHAPPYNAEVNNAWYYTSTPPYVFMAWCLSAGITFASALTFTFTFMLL